MPVTVYNELREPTGTQMIAAAYQVFNRTSTTRVRANVVVEDLRAKQQALFKGSRSGDEKVAVRYIDWTGDERGLSPFVLAIGTDQHPPPPPRTLTQQVTSKVADNIVGDVVAALDNSSAGGP